MAKKNDKKKSDKTFENAANVFICLTALFKLLTEVVSFIKSIIN